MDPWVCSEIKEENCELGEQLDLEPVSLIIMKKTRTTTVICVFRPRHMHIVHCT